MKQKIEKHCIKSTVSIVEALKTMDNNKTRLLIVLENGKFLSLLSIGDIQRAIIKNIELTTPIKSILRDIITVGKAEDKIEDLKFLMTQNRIEFMPIVDDKQNLIDIILWEDLFSEKTLQKKELNLPVVIMAGGKGTRLRPLTNIIPKPLIPINDKTIIEDIMDRFVEHGCSKFFLSVNYKADMIKFYLDSINNSYYEISYFQEEKPLGTAGSLFLLKEKIKSTFFVNNCDILIDEDYNEILKYHQDNKNEITLVAAMKHISLPYGTLQTSENSFHL
ncbi:MAG: sugar phosphate nucleotidyltransferase [Candidatus Nanoarchaeia archaeon]|nr:sugar phosphate nucleotidyltransferase [Candidatus Nanoarchaeia archaeon]